MGAANKNSPLNDFTKREVRTLQLTPTEHQERGVTGQMVKAVIDGFAWVRRKFGEETEIKLVGVNESDSEVTIDPEDIVDAFGAIDVAHLATDLELSRPVYYDALACKMLTEVADQYPEYFGRPSR